MLFNLFGLFGDHDHHGMGMDDQHDFPDFPGDVHLHQEIVNTDVVNHHLDVTNTDFSTHVTNNYFVMDDLSYHGGYDGW